MTFQILLITFYLATLCTKGTQGNGMQDPLSLVEQYCLSSQAETEDELELCKYENLGILTTEGQLVPAEQMGVNLDHTFGEWIEDQGDLVAQAIHKRCGPDLMTGEADGSSVVSCISDVLKIGTVGVFSKVHREISDRAEMVSKETADDFPPVKMIYPNLTCHPSYNSDRNDSSRGEGYLLKLYKFCYYDKGGNKKPPECMKICMAEYIGLIDTRWQDRIRAQWNTFNEMVNNVRQLLVGFNTKSGQQIVRKILDKCYYRIKLVEYSRTNPCHTTKWRSFFECLDSVWDCPSMIAAG